jgi:hypothetical protein
VRFAADGLVAHKPDYLFADLGDWRGVYEAIPAREIVRVAGMSARRSLSSL